MADGVADLHLQEKLALMKKGGKKIGKKLESGKNFSQPIYRRVVFILEVLKTLFTVKITVVPYCFSGRPGTEKNDHVFHYRIHERVLANCCCPNTA